MFKIPIPIDSIIKFFGSLIVQKRIGNPKNQIVYCTGLGKYGEEWEENGVIAANFSVVSILRNIVVVPFKCTVPPEYKSQLMNRETHIIIPKELIEQSIEIPYSVVDEPEEFTKQLKKDDTENKIQMRGYKGGGALRVTNNTPKRFLNFPLSKTVKIPIIDSRPDNVDDLIFKGQETLKERRDFEVLVNVTPLISKDNRRFWQCNITWHANIEPKSIYLYEIFYKY